MAVLQKEIAENFLAQEPNAYLLLLRDFVQPCEKICGMCKERMLEALVKGASAEGAHWTDGVEDRLEDKLGRLGIAAENKYGLLLPPETLNFDPNARHLAIDWLTWSRLLNAWASHIMHRLGTKNTSLAAADPYNLVYKLWLAGCRKYTVEHLAQNRSVADFVELHGWLLGRRQRDGCSCSIYNILGDVSLDVLSPHGWVDLVLKSARKHMSQEILDSWEAPIREPLSSGRRPLCDGYSPSMSRGWRDGWEEIHPQHPYDERIRLSEKTTGGSSRNVSSSTASQALSRLRNDAAHVLVKKVLEPEWKHACQKGHFRRLIKQGDELTDKSTKQANSDAAAAPNGGISETLAIPELVEPSRPTRR
ncbi:hypothetical protein B0T24DRAFT_195659 [Lasiosphaeria ovina]|uniref:Uncharacterized protein n=1 Tax=Lasiosphaeria ovina TaxID=92902 RepID=A0AAE0NFC3_9PEZI|nr:hypothetical protein B0T24DRAFT_195659 [Lasiosphaeria ovina]